MYVSFSFFFSDANCSSISKSKSAGPLGRVFSLIARCASYLSAKSSNFTLNELGSVSNSNSMKPEAININNRKTMKHEQPIVQHITLQGSFAIFFICQGMTASIGEEIISP